MSKFDSRGGSRLLGFAASRHGRIVCQQLAFNYGNLSVDDSEHVQLTAASKCKVLDGVCKRFRLVRVLHRAHEHEQRGCCFIAGPTDYVCKALDLFSTGIIFVRIGRFGEIDRCVVYYCLRATSESIADCDLRCFGFVRCWRTIALP